MSNFNTKPCRQNHFIRLALVLAGFFLWAQCASLWHSVDHDHHLHPSYCDSLLAAQAQPLVATAQITLFIPAIINHNTAIALAILAIAFPTHWRHLARAPPALMSVFFR